jgi:hypothetical protein
MSITAVGTQRCYADHDVHARAQPRAVIRNHRPAFASQQLRAAAAVTPSYDREMKQALVAIVLAACAVDPATEEEQADLAADAPKHVVPTRDAIHAAATNGISYHGGSVMTATTNTAYLIWYGNWSGNTATPLLTNLAQSIGGSPYFNINTTYYNRLATHVTNAVRYGGSTTDSYSQGKALDDNAVQAVVSSAITSGRLPSNSNGVYFVLTSADVNETSGFCTQYCGWHWYGTIGTRRIKYAFIGNPDRCPSSCEEQTTSPNGNAGADGMASIIAHELEETVTDPYGSAWYDASGEENADKCAWTFGTESTASNGSKYNVTLGGTRYLIQQNWVNASGGFCAMSH